MSGPIRRVRRKRKASTIREGPAAGRSITEKPHSRASIGAPSGSSRSIACSSPVRREPASIGNGLNRAMPPGQWGYPPVGEKFSAPRLFRHWIHAIAATKKTLHR